MAFCATSWDVGSDLSTGARMHPCQTPSIGNPWLEIMRVLSKTSDPYCAFKNDRDRLRALISRDLRYVVVVLTLAISGRQIPWASFARLLGFAA